ncbi:MAG: serine O-acetyltransferase [Planctomycetota bacterium]|nr:serine O-acetyltransferase [Planctomycetota bacterium]
MFDRIREDIKAVFRCDPAPKSTLEVFLCYPGMHALWVHRVAHWFYNRGMYFVARLVSHVNRFLTGVEIHPGAKFGRRVFIDHGMGIVVGETAEIGDDCLIYKGVVLGGTSTDKKKRHPTLGRCVTVGSNACVLGPITIGAGARIGCCSVVVKSVPAGATVVGVPARVVEHHVETAVDLEHGQIQDPISVVAAGLLEMLENVDKRLQAVEHAQGIVTGETICAHCKGRKFFSGETSDEKPPAESGPPACPANGAHATAEPGPEAKTG